MLICAIGKSSFWIAVQTIVRRCAIQGRKLPRVCSARKRLQCRACELHTIEGKAPMEKMCFFSFILFFFFVACANGIGRKDYLASRTFSKSLQSNPSLFIARLVLCFFSLLASYFLLLLFSLDMSERDSKRN